MTQSEIQRPQLAPAPTFPLVDLKLSDWKNGVAVRSPNWLGDAVMTLPALNQLKKIIPEHCGLFIVCPPSLKGFYDTLPMVDKIICLTRAHKNWTRSDVKHVNRLHAGICLMFNNSLRDTIFFRLARIARLFGASARGRAVLLSGSFKFPPRKDCELNQLHHAEKYLSMVYSLGAPKWQGEMPAFNIPSLDEAKRNPLVNKVFSSGKLMTLAAGAAYGGSKRWPAESFNQVSRYWIDTGGTVAVLGTAGERDMAQEAIKDLPDGNAFNLAGETSLPELMAVLKYSELCIANDSGIMHLSAALGGSGIAVFGPTDPSATSPVSTRWQVLFEKQDCAPCFKRECPSSSSKCMKAVAPEKVIEIIKGMQ
ncbi:MAG: lipopolysaccharide heptosyltransferase II [Victivallales bacterium]|nr:lipopolysaccharide heptosyltransferase II [Victivallales bacterium]